MTGLENRLAGAYAWNETGETVFPRARFFHKGGWISSYSLDLAALDDPESGVCILFAVAAATGKTETVKEMSRRLAAWALNRSRNTACDHFARSSAVAYIAPAVLLTKAVKLRLPSLISS